MKMKEKYKYSEAIKEIIDLYNSGKTINQIEMMTKVPHSSVSNYLHRNGINELIENSRKRRSKTMKRLYAEGKLIPYWKGKQNHKLSIARTGKLNPKLSETRKRLFAERKLINPMQGKHHTMSAKIKMSVANIGKPKPKSLETKRKMSEAAIGEKNHNFGKSLSEEQRQRCRETMKNKYADGYINPMLGTHRSEETWAKMRKSGMIRPTKPEIKLDSILQIHFPNEWKYVGDGQVVIGYHNPDFINNNGKKQLIEVFGDWWHFFKKLKNNPEHTREREEQLFKYHYKQFGNFDTLVIWEHELKDENVVIEKIRNFQ